MSKFFASLMASFAGVLLLAPMALAAHAEPGFPDEPPAPGPAPTIDLPTPVEHTLDNGLRVIVVPHGELPLVGVDLAIFAGSEVDPANLPGAARVTASMLTHGTQSRSATEIASQAAALGGAIRAGAGWDESNLRITVTTPKLDEALALVADVAVHPAFAADELERVRKRARDGLRLAMSSPGTLAGMALRRAVFGHGMYGHPGAGSMASLKAINSKDLEALHHRWYRPDNAVLVLAGGVEPKAAFELARQAFGDWQRPEAPLPRAEAGASASKAAALTVIDMDGAGQAGVAAGNLAIPRHSEDYYAGLVTNAVLGGGYSARLNAEIRIKRGLSYGASSALVTLQHGGWLHASAQTKNASAAAVVKLMRQQFASLRQHPPQADELQARKATLIGAFGRSLESVGGIAGQVAERAVYGVPLDEINHYIERIEAVDSDDVRDFAKAYLGADGLHVVVVGDADVFGKAVRKAWPEAETIAVDKLDLSQPDLGGD